uniref:Uncharacterized protein n=1 Tax=Amblyomma americanum TaxID=6943 RepID=A0A0C9RVS1_AMBAM
MVLPAGTCLGLSFCSTRLPATSSHDYVHVIVPTCRIQFVLRIWVACPQPQCTVLNAAIAAQNSSLTLQVSQNTALFRVIWLNRHFRDQDKTTTMSHKRKC